MGLYLRDYLNCLFFFFFLDFLSLYGTIFKVFYLLQYCFCFFHVLVFWPQGLWDLTPHPGFEPAPPTVAGKVLHTGRLGKSSKLSFFCELARIYIPSC